MLSCFAWSQSEAVTLYAVDYPPYLIVSEDEQSQEVSGMDAEIIRAAFAAVDVDVHYQVQAWDSILTGMEHGQLLGTASCMRRPERLPYMFYSDEISTTSQVFISRRELEISPVQTLEQLQTYNIVSVANWAPQKLMEQLGIRHQVAASLDEALLKIEDGSADLLYIAEYPALAQAKKLGIHDHIKATPLASQPLNTQHLCVSRQYPHARTVVDQFNLGLREIKRNGTYQAIRNRYL
nr:transporter substrate-binding domain-containing protein [Marinomonas ostreistagni]